MNIAICDDEQEYIDDVENHLNLYFSEHGMSFDLFTFNNSADILNCKTKFDIAFLDIEIDNVNGIEIGKQLKKRNPEIILIFVTAYNHYLDETLDLGIVRFFEKPIETKRFFQGMDKAIEIINNAEIKIHLRDTENGVVTVLSKDVIYAEISGRKTKIVTADDVYYSKENIKYWTEKLNKSYFMYPHKSFIINTNFVTYYCKDYMVLNGEYRIPVAYSKRAKFNRNLSIVLGD